MLRLSTVLRRKDGSSGDDSLAPARLYLGHVCSWQPLGSATVECIGGCVCKKTKMRHQWDHQSTQSALLALPVGAPPAGLLLGCCLGCCMVEEPGPCQWMHACFDATGRCLFWPVSTPAAGSSSLFHAAPLQTSCPKPNNVQVSQHEQCEVKITVNKPAEGKKAASAAPSAATAAAASNKQPPRLDPATMLTSAMVDNADEATIDRGGNVGQWDLVG